MEELGLRTRKTTSSEDWARCKRMASRSGLADLTVDSDVENLLWFPDWVALFICHRARNMPQQ